jgi:hypothetical protein
MSLVPYHPREGREIVLYVIGFHPQLRDPCLQPFPAANCLDGTSYLQSWTRDAPP